MKKMIVLVGLFAIVLRGLGESPTTVKRPEARSKEVMSSNDYVGVWRDDWAMVVLRQDGTGLFAVPAKEIALKWSGDGKGRIDAQMHYDGEVIVTNRMAYDCKTDALTLSFDEKLFGSALTLKLPYASEILPEKKEEKSTFLLSKAECEEAIKNGDKELRRMDSLDDFPDPRDLLATSNGWFMVDDDYPRLVLRPDEMFPQVIWMRMHTGRYDSPMGAATLSDNRTTTYLCDDTPDVQIGWPRKRTEGLEKRLGEKGIRCSVYACAYQQPFRYSREDYIGTVVLKNLDAFVAILKDELKDMKFPRYYRRYRVKSFDEQDEEAGRPRRKRQSIDDIVEY